MLCFHLNKSLCNFYSPLHWISFHIPSLPFLFKSSKLLDSLRIKRMYALHLSVTYNVTSDVLSSFQTKPLLVSGAYMKIWPGRQWNGGVSLDQNPKNDLRDRRNFGFHTVNSSPSLCSSWMRSTVFLSFPLFCSMWTAWLPVEIHSHWCISIRQKFTEGSEDISLSYFIWNLVLKSYFASHKLLKLTYFFSQGWNNWPCFKYTSNDLNDLENEQRSTSFVTPLAPSKNR